MSFWRLCTIYCVLFLRPFHVLFCKGPASEDFAVLRKMRWAGVSRIMPSASLVQIGCREVLDSKSRFHFISHDHVIEDASSRCAFVCFGIVQLPMKWLRAFGRWRELPASGRLVRVHVGK